MNETCTAQPLVAPAAEGGPRSDSKGWSEKSGDTLHVVYGLTDGAERSVSLSTLRVAVLALVFAAMSLWTVLSLAWVCASTFNRFWHGEPDSYDVPVLIVPLERASTS